MKKILKKQENEEIEVVAVIGDLNWKELRNFLIIELMGCDDEQQFNKLILCY